MKLRVLGCHGPYPPAGGCTSGYLLENDGKALLMDCGAGVMGRLAQYWDAANLEAVLLSHLHFDHAGQLDDFPNAAVCLREAELQAAFPPSRGDYVEADYRHIRERKIERIPDEGDYDFFGDDSLICLDTKGHSPGHQSFLVRLPNTGDVLLTVDAAHLHQYLETDRFYQDAWDVEKAGAAAARLKELSGTCAVTLFGHDPASFRKARLAPEYYD